jgi:hypothetical protein
MAGEDRKQFSLEELVFLFETLDRLQSPCVLMGGQSACYWARRFLATEPALREMERVSQFVSKDVDFQGSRQAAIDLARALRATPEVPGFRQAFGNLMAGKMTLGSGTERLSIEVLRKVPGLTENEVARLSGMEPFAHLFFRVLNPLAVLMAKSWNVVHIRKDDRHDAEQLLTLAPCVRAHLRGFLESGATDETVLRAGLNLVERALKFAELPLAREAARRCGVDWAWLLPHRFIAATAMPQLVRLRERRLPGWLDRVSRYERMVPGSPVVLRLLAILADHAEPLCATPAQPNRPSAIRNRQSR